MPLSLRSCRLPAARSVRMCTLARSRPPARSHFRAVLLPAAPPPTGPGVFDAMSGDLDFLLALGKSAQTEKLMETGSVDTMKLVCVDESSQEDMPSAKVKGATGATAQSGSTGSSVAGRPGSNTDHSPASSKPTAKCSVKGRGRGRGKTHTTWGC